MEKPAEATANVPADTAWTACVVRPLVTRDVWRVARCTLVLAMVLVETSMVAPTHTTAVWTRVRPVVVRMVPVTEAVAVHLMETALLAVRLIARDTMS